MKKLELNQMEKTLAGCDPAYQEAFAGLVGSMLGPIGGFITWAVVHEAIKQNGGECI